MDEDSWTVAQERTFRNWINEELRKCGQQPVAHLAHDLQDGTVLCTLLEALSAQRLPAWNQRPRMRLECVHNVSVCLQQLREHGAKIVGVGPEDIVDGLLKPILGLVWAIVLRFHVQVGNGSARIALLKWLRSKVPEVKDLSSDWRSGVALSALVAALRPGSVSGPASDAVGTISLAMEAAERHVGIPAILAPEDMAAENPDEPCIMTYLAYFRKAEAQGGEACAIRVLTRWVRHRQQRAGVPLIEKLEDLWPASKMQGFLGRLLGVAADADGGDEEARARHVVAFLQDRGVQCKEEAAAVASLSRPARQLGAAELECVWAVVRLTLVTELGLDAKNDEALMRALSNRYANATMHALSPSNVLPVMSDIVERLSDWKRNGDSADEVLTVVEGALALLMAFPLLERRDLNEQCGGDMRVLMLALALLLDPLDDSSKRLEISTTHSEHGSVEQLQELIKSQAARIRTLELELQEREKAVETVSKEVSARLRNDNAAREKLAETELRMARLTEQLQHMEHDTALAMEEHRKLMDEKKTMTESIKQYKDSLTQTRAKLKAAIANHEHCEKERRVQRQLFEDLTLELGRREHSVAAEARRLEEKLAALVSETSAMQKRVEDERDLALLELVASRHAQSMLEGDLSRSRAAAKELETELTIMREAQRVHDEEMDRSMQAEAEATQELKRQLKAEAEQGRLALAERDEAVSRSKTLEEERDRLLARINSIEDAARTREDELLARVRDCEQALEGRRQEMEIEMKSREKKLRRAERKRVEELEKALQAEISAKEKAIVSAKQAEASARITVNKHADLNHRQLDVENKAHSMRARRVAWAMWWVVLALCCMRVFFAPCLEI